MNLTTTELQEKIAQLENELEPYKAELNSRLRKSAEATLHNIGLAYKLKFRFSESELRFSRHDKCECGAGLAYPLSSDIHGSWHCSSILLGTASTSVPHIDQRPFAFYSIKSENEFSTTRPQIKDAE